MTLPAPLPADTPARLSALEAFARKPLDTIVCSICAYRVVRRFGGQIYGYFFLENPGAVVGRLGWSQGHDFAVVGDFLVDAWAHQIEGSIPRPVLHLRTDRALIRRYYGPKRRWSPVHIPSLEEAIKAVGV